MAREIIWKHELIITDSQGVYVPLGARFLAVGNQSGKLMLWFSHTNQRGREDRFIRIVGTGNGFESNNLIYIGTAQVGDFVWHVFEELANGA